MREEHTFADTLPSAPAQQVTSRGGFFVRSGNRHPYSWSGDIFPGMKVRVRGDVSCSHQCR